MIKQLQNPKTKQLNPSCAIKFEALEPESGAGSMASGPVLAQVPVPGSFQGLDLVPAVPG